MTTQPTTKIAPEAGQGSEGTIHNIPAGDTMNKTVLTVADARDIHWRDVQRNSVVRVECDEPGCLLFGTPHLLKWGDMLEHTASQTAATDMRIAVVRFAASDDVPEAESHWYVSGFLCDDDTTLTPDRVAFFTAHYNSAAALAAELNGENA